MRGRVGALLDAFLPVLVKEMRGRMRGARAFGILTVALLGFSGFSALVYAILVNTSTWDPRTASSAYIGQSLFRSLMLFETFTLLLIVPGLAAGAISQEHESRTYEMLVATPLPAAGIVLGKMGATLSYVLLLLIATVPFTSLFFVFGGITISDVVTVLALLMAIAATFAAITMFFSALLKRTVRAVVLSYVLVAAWIGLPFFGFIAHGILRNDVPPRFWLVPSPLSAVSSAFSVLSPESFFTAIGQGVAPGAVTMRPTWHFTLLLYAFLALPAVIGTAHFVRPAGRRRALRRELAALALGWGLLFVVALVTFRPEDWRGLFVARQPQPVQHLEIREAPVEVAPPPTPVPERTDD